MTPTERADLRADLAYWVQRYGVIVLLREVVEVLTNAKEKA